MPSATSCARCPDRTPVLVRLSIQGDWPCSSNRSCRRVGMPRTLPTPFWVAICLYQPQIATQKAGGSALGQAPDGVGDGGGVDPRAREELVGLARAGQLADGELRQLEDEAAVGQGVEDGVADARLGPVVL